MDLELVFVDVETGGPDPEEHSILSLKAVMWTNDLIHAEFSTLISEPDLAVTDQAMVANGLSLDDIARDGLIPDDAVAEFQGWRADNFNGQDLRMILAGHNVDFQSGFVKRLYRLSDDEYRSRFSYRTVDIFSMVTLLRAAGRLDFYGPSLDEVCAQFGIQIGEGGRARATAELFSKLLALVQP